MATLREQFGTAGTKGGGGGYTKYARINRLTDASKRQVRAVMPPMFSLQKLEGGWTKRYALHGGYNVPRPSDPTKTNFIQFLCVEEFEWGAKKGERIITQACPKCVQYDAEKAKIDAIRVDMERAKKSDSDIYTTLAPFDKWMKEHSCRRTWVMNTLLENGEFDLFGVNTKAKLDFEAKLDKCNKQEQINSLSVDSLVFWEWIRVGTGKKASEMAESATPLTEQIKLDGGRTASMVKKVCLTDEQCEKALKDCHDLATLDKTEILTLTPAQIKQLVDCSGDPDEVQAIVAAAMPAPKKNTTTVQMPATPPPVEPKKSEPVTPEPPTVAATDSPAIAALKAQLAAALAAASAPAQETKKQEVKAPEPQKAAAPAVDAPAIDKTDDELLAELGLNT